MVSAAGGIVRAAGMVSAVGGMLEGVGWRVLEGVGWRVEGGVSVLEEGESMRGREHAWASACVGESITKRNVNHRRRGGEEGRRGVGEDGPH